MRSHLALSMLLLSVAGTATGEEVESPNVAAAAKRTQIARAKAKTLQTSIDKALLELRHSCRPQKFMADGGCAVAKQVNGCKAPTYAYSVRRDKRKAARIEENLRQALGDYAAAGGFVELDNKSEAEIRTRIDAARSAVAQLELEAMLRIAAPSKVIAGNGLDPKFLEWIKAHRTRAKHVTETYLLLAKETAVDNEARVRAAIQSAAAMRAARVHITSTELPRKMTAEDKKRACDALSQLASPFEQSATENAGFCERLAKELGLSAMTSGCR